MSEIVLMPSELSLLVIGEVGRAEFQAAYASLTAQWSTTAVADVNAALQWLSDHDAPALIVLAESRPGEFSAQAVETLRQRAPLARWWSLAGSWCEGESRSGKPAPGVLRSYWHQWPARVGAEQARQAAGRPPAWTLPQTAGEEERCLWAAAEPCDKRTSTVLIRGASRQAVEALAAACRLRGKVPIDVGMHSENDEAVSAVSPAVMLWDTTAERAGRADLVASMRAAGGGAPIVAVVGFPRADQVERILAAGCSGIVSKPFRLEDLYWQLDQAEVHGTARARLE
jgi:CheY-like chemotaxis protein